MMHQFSLWYGLGTQSILFCMLFMLLPGIKNTSGLPRWLIALGLITLSVLPVFKGIPLVYYLRGLLGDLSIPTIALLLAVIYGQIPAWQATRKRLLTLTAITGVCFYPMVLGASRIDPYQWGFHPAGLSAALAVIVFFSWRTHSALVWIIGAAVMAFNIGLMESGNLWDYLIDPVLSVFATGWLLFQAAKFWIYKKQI